MTTKMEVGEIVNTVGLKGEVKIWPYVDYFMKIKKIYINDIEMEIEKARAQKNVIIAKIKGIDTIEEAETYRKAIITMERADAPKLPKGKYYINDLIGFEVITDEGEVLGKLDDIFNTGANDVYQVGKILLPGIPDVIKQIDTDNKKILVHLLNGLR